MRLATSLFHPSQVGIPSQLYPNNLTFSHCLPWKNMVGTHLPADLRGIWRQLIGLWLLEAFGAWRYLRDHHIKPISDFYGQEGVEGLTQWKFLEPPGKGLDMI